MHKFFAKTEYLGKSVTLLPQCHSTNDIALQLVKKPDTKEGAVVIAQHQTAGRGQRGNQWEAEAGLNATFSLVLKPRRMKINDLFAIHVFTSLGIYDALFKLLGSNLTIKWPNDIYYKDRKLGGILIENGVKGKMIEHAILGIGININQLTFSTPTATSLAEITGQTWEINDFIEQTLQHIEIRYSEWNKGRASNQVLQYHRRLYLFETAHDFKTSSGIRKGKIVGINESGKLRIQFADEKVETFDFKEVAYL